MTAEKNMEKYEIYKSMYDNLNKAMKNGFYYESIFIEYAILEDRLSAVLRYANIKCTDKDGKTIPIAKKISMIKGRPEFADKYFKERLPEELMDSVGSWVVLRNKLIHNLANVPYDSDKVKSVAETGNELVKVVSNKSRSVINRLKKKEV